ncbi:hypothetical protein H2248_001770 [Termitomyces sp. 'cryptogamus']|nr:hypothetical protein H2248_001770 [Termitomyces sp. 'cryptogamus']
MANSGSPLTRRCGVSSSTLFLPIPKYLSPSFTPPSETTQCIESSREEEQAGPTNTNTIYEDPAIPFDTQRTSELASSTSRCEDIISTSSRTERVIERIKDAEEVGGECEGSSIGEEFEENDEEIDEVKVDVGEVKEVEKEEPRMRI